MSKNALVCVGSPFQTLCAVDALSYFDIDSYDFIVIDDGTRLFQIENFLNLKGIVYKVIPFHVSTCISLKRIVGLFNIWSGKYDYLFMGDYRLTGNRLECIPYVKYGGKVFFLDDGTYIVDLANSTIKTTLITKIRNSLFDFICKIRSISWRNFYTIYANNITLEGFNVVENKFKSLQTKCCNLSNDVYFIGTNPLGEGVSYCRFLDIDYKEYLSKLSDVLEDIKLRNKTGEIYYIPHGRDFTNETKEVCNRLGIIYKKCNMCIEMEFATLNALPSIIVGFGSTALFTLRRMCPNTNIINLHILGKNKKANFIYMKIADLYSKVGITNQII